MYTLALILGKCVATLRGAFFGVFLNGARFFCEVFMLYEKVKLRLHRLFWLILLLFGIFAPVYLLKKTDNIEVEIVEDNGHIINYFEYLNETSCEIEVTFNVKVESGYITIAFYDSNDRLLSKEKGYFWGYDKTLSSTFSVDGKVDSYLILECEISASDDEAYDILLVLFLFCDIFIFAIFIASLTLSCKQYMYKGDRIVVYAGWYHHYIKVNKQKYDEHNTLVSFTAIQLSCTLNDGTDIKATITMSNRISLKINNQLYTKRK